jgi:hypothetical protein
MGCVPLSSWRHPLYKFPVQKALYRRKSHPPPIPSTRDQHNVLLEEQA